MRAYYQILEAIKHYLTANININTVRIGNINEVDLKKQTIYPLAHIIAGEVDFRNQTLAFNMRVVVMDSVVETLQPKDVFGKIDNKIDVSNSMLTVINGLQQQLKLGDLYNANFQLDGEPVATPFEDEYSNVLTGWSLEFTVLIPNNEIGICDYQLDWDISGSLPTEKYMEKIIYDVNNNGIVDNSERLGGELPSYYAQSNHIHDAIDIVFSPTGSLTATEVQTAILQASEQGFTESEVLNFINGIGTVSGSSQIDHNETTNYVENEHLDWSVSQSLDIHPDNYITGSDVTLPSGLVSGSDQLSGSFVQTTGDEVIQGLKEFQDYTEFHDNIQLDAGNFIKLGESNFAHSTLKYQSGNTDLVLSGSNFRIRYTDEGAIQDGVIYDKFSGTLWVNNFFIGDGFKTNTGTNTNVLLDGGGTVALSELTGSLSGSFVTISGTPLDDQLGVWTDGDTMEGTPSLRYNTSTGLTIESGSVSAINGVIVGKQGKAGVIQFIRSVSGAAAGTFIHDEAYGGMKLQGLVKFKVDSTVEGEAFIVSGGTSDDFLKGDGTLSTGSFIDILGTPLDNEIVLWAGSGSVKRDIQFTYDAALGKLSLGTSGSNDVSSIAGTDGKVFIEYSDGQGTVSTNGNDLVAASFVKVNATADDILLGNGLTTSLGNLVTDVTGGTAITSSGGSTPELSLEDTAVTPGLYNFANVTVDQQGRITDIGHGTVSGSVDLTNVAYTNVDNHFQVDQTISGSLYISSSEEDFSRIELYKAGVLRFLVDTNGNVSGSTFTGDGSGLTGITSTVPDGTVSGSIQVDHDQTTNYNSLEHFEQSAISITESQISDFNSAEFLPLSGGVMTGDIVIGDNEIFINDNGGINFVDEFRLSYNGSAQVFQMKANGVEKVNIEVNDFNFKNLRVSSDMTPPEIASGSNQLLITKGFFNTNALISSEDVDHNATTNYLANEHFTQASISITESQISDLTHYIDSDTKNLMNVDGVISGSSQIDHNQTTNFTSSEHYEQSAIIITESQISDLVHTVIPIGTVSSSLQVDHNQTLNYSSSRHFLQSDISITESQISDLGHTSNQDIRDVMNTDGVISGSSQVTFNGITDKPTLVSSSIQIDHDLTTNFTSSEHFTQNEIIITESQISDLSHTVIPDGTISGSIQVDHNATTNYSSSRHFEQSDISITESQISDLSHTVIPSGTISGSSQLDGTTILALTGSFNGSFDGLVFGQLGGEFSGSANGDFTGDGSGLTNLSESQIGDLTHFTVSDLPVGTVSSSIQIDHDATTNWSQDEHFTQAQILISTSKISDFNASVKNRLDSENVFTGSAQLNASLVTDGVFPSSVIPAIAITDTFVAINEVQQLSLTIQQGDVCVRTDENKTYINLIGNNNTMSDWQVMLTPSGAVVSVNSQTGVVVLNSTNIAEGTNLYYTETRVSNNSAVSANTSKVGFTDSLVKAKLNTDNVISGSNQIEFTEITNVPTTIISGSIQVDHDATTNYSADEHFTEASISITESQISDLNHFTVSDLPSGTVSGSSQLTGSYDTRYTLSGSISPLPSGIVSSSIQIDVEQTTNFGNIEQYNDADNLAYMNTINVLSGSVDLTDVAYTNVDNNFSVGQTISGSLLITGSNGELLKVTDEVGGDVLTIIDQGTQLLNVSASGQVDISGSVYALDYYGDGSKLSGIATSLPAGVVSGSSQIDHDNTTNYVVNEHLDWSVDQGGTNIHPDNIVGGVDFVPITGNTDITGSISIYNSGSTVFAVSGSQGELMRVDDDVSIISGSVLNIFHSGSEVLSVDVSGSVYTTGQYNLRELNTAPSSASDTGTLGEIRTTATHIYVCTSTDTWKRTALTTW